MSDMPADFVPATISLMPGREVVTGWRHGSFLVRTIGADVWVVSHVPTGLNLPRWVSGRSDAVEMTREVQNCRTDWETITFADRDDIAAAVIPIMLCHPTYPITARTPTRLIEAAFRERINGATGAEVRP